MNILLVEDEALVAMFLGDALTHSGYVVQGPVDSVAEGIAEAERSRPDLALIDINLGMGGNGVDLARDLHDRWKIPVLFLSAYGLKARNAKDVAIGLIEKPYSPTLVLKCVRYVMEWLAGGKPGSPPDGLELFRPS